MILINVTAFKASQGSGSILDNLALINLNPANKTAGTLLGNVH